jgi:hypothetical protein
VSGLGATGGVERDGLSHEQPTLVAARASSVCSRGWWGNSRGAYPPDELFSAPACGFEGTWG